MATISQNQNDYLQNLVKAGGGNGEWAKSQLNGATVEQPKQPLSAIANNTPTASDMIGSIYDKNYAAQSQKLRSLRDTQLAGLAGQEDVINQNKVAGLNQNDVLANNNWRSLKESMANAGVNGGDSVTAQIGNQTAQQQGAVDINNNASNQLKQLMAQRAAINNNASADDLALMQGLQATRDTQSLGDLYKNREYGISEAGLTGNYNGQRTLAGLNSDRGFALDEAGLTGLYNGNSTMAAKQNNIGNAFQLSQLTGNLYQPKSDAGVLFGQDPLGRTLQGSTFDETKNQNAIGNAFNEKQFTAQQGNISADNVRAAGAQAAAAGNASMATLFKIWENTGVAPAGIPNVAPGTPLKGSGTTPKEDGFNLDDYKGQINQNFYKEQLSDPYNPNSPKVKTFDSVGARKYIIGLGRPDAETDKLLQFYGLPTN